jgi:hypothetical protein
VSQNPVALEEKVRLAPSERAVWDGFKRRLIANDVKEFSSDTLRDWGFEKGLYGDQSKVIGLFFFKLKRLGEIVEVGRTRSLVPSNHSREIRVYARKVQSS